AVARVVRLPAVEALGPQAPEVDAVVRPAANADDPPAGDADVQRTAVGAEHAGGLNPAFRLARQVLVDAGRPLRGTRMGCSPAPWIRDPVDHGAPIPSREPDKHGVATLLRRYG